MGKDKLKLPFLIIGGGIGGLATARALKCVGINVKVIERAPEIKEVGAGITVWSNAVAAIQALGLYEDFLEFAQPAQSTVIHDWKGRTLSSIDLSTLKAKFGYQSYTVHRAELLSMLLKSIGTEDVILGASCQQVNPHADHVEIVLSNGQTLRGSCLIGADGLHSTVRRLVVGEYSNSFRGYFCWRAITNFSSPQISNDTSFLALGRGSQFGMFPLSKGRVYWFATKNTRKPRGAAVHILKAELEETFESWMTLVPSLISATSEFEILGNDIYDRNPNPKWGKGNMTLVGDAAHASTPNLGQGACMALEDAVALAHCLNSLDDSDDLEKAFRLYEKLRYRRTRSIVLESRFMGWSFQVENGMLSWMRDLATKLCPDAIMRKNLEKNLRFDVPDSFRTL